MKKIKSIIAEKTIEIVAADRKAIPPIVGVPLFDKCHDGPSSYIGCCAFIFKYGINFFSMRAVRMRVNKKTKTYAGKYLSNILYQAFRFLRLFFLRAKRAKPL